MNVYLGIELVLTMMFFIILLFAVFGLFLVVNVFDKQNNALDLREQFRDEANKDDENINRSVSTGKFFKYTTAVDTQTYYEAVTHCTNEDIKKLVALGYLETNINERLCFVRRITHAKLLCLTKRTGSVNQRS